MFSFVYPVNSPYKYVKKVKPHLNSYQYIFSEIIEYGVVHILRN